MKRRMLAPYSPPTLGGAPSSWKNPFPVDGNELYLLMFFYSMAAMVMWKSVILYKPGMVSWSSVLLEPSTETHRDKNTHYGGQKTFDTNVVCAAVTYLLY